jgi:glycosyltransferase involved in cell wall biosynthesis
MNHPTISAIIPCYNGAKFLRSTLDSVLAQTMPACEILVVDDGSTDESAAIAASCGPPVRLIRQPNQGESVARNRGIDEARGDWAAFLDADDLWLPEKLAEQARLMTPAVDAVCATALFCRDGEVESSLVPQPACFDRATILEHWSPCHISTVLVRREIPVRFPAWTSYAEDVVYYLDLLPAVRFAIADGPLVTCRWHADNQSAHRLARARHEATLRRWLEISCSRLTPAEAAELNAALRRREKRHLLSQALKCRREKQPAVAMTFYARLLARSLYTASSPGLVGCGLRGMLGAAVESVGLRSPPAFPGPARPCNTFGGQPAEATPCGLP